MNNKAQITAFQIFAGLIVLAMVSVGLISFMTSLITEYEVEGSVPLTVNETNIYGSFNILDEMENSSSNVMSTIQSQTDKPSILQYFIIAPAIIWATIKIVLTLPITMISLVGVIAGALGFPSWIITGATALISALIGFLVLSAIIKWRMT